MSTKFDFDYIQEIIDEKRRENLRLEFKSNGALVTFRNNSDHLSKQKMSYDIAHVVSAFANAEGGIIIYGISEQESCEDKETPIKTSERRMANIEGIIRDCISPPVQYTAYEIKLHDWKPNEYDLEDRIYVIEVEKSDTAHMVIKEVNGKNGKDGKVPYRYYQRTDEGNKVMMDFQVRDVMNRAKLPNLKLDFGFKTDTFAIHKNDGSQSKLYKLSVRVINSGKILAKFWKVILTLDDNTPSSDDPFDQRYYERITLHFGGLHPYTQRKNDLQGNKSFIFTYPCEKVIFPEDEIALTSELDFYISEDTIIKSGNRGIEYKLYADNMVPKGGFLEFSEVDR